MSCATDGIPEDLVADSLMSGGIARASFGSLEAFVRACGKLGEILSIDDVSLIAGSRRHVSNPGSIPFHSDGPAADVVAWFCIRQDEEAGESLLADAVPILRGLAPAHRAHLRSVNIPYFDHAHPGKPAGYCALLRGNHEAEWCLNYASWLLPEMGEDQRAAVAALDDALSAVVATSLRLAPGQSLFIDNWRILHARGALRPDSRRHLKRIWLRTPRASRMDRIAARPDRRAVL
ncbi:MAG TPA: TauD/TfdA family dioxygenase [Hyphomicrobium sp.]|nr:TauD/TfdA family dioxygenase [Hyphomicrobium sp.]